MTRLLLLVLLLIAAPAWAVPIELTGGTIDQSLIPSVILIGPDFSFIGNVVQDPPAHWQLGVFDETGFSSASLTGMLIFQGSSYLVHRCDVVVETTCGFLASHSHFVFPADALSLTIPFTLTAEFEGLLSLGLIDHILLEPLTATGSGLLTLSLPNLAHYTISDPVPEPATWLLLLTGLCLGIMRHVIGRYSASSRHRY